MCEIDLEPCEVWVVTKHTARKPYRCHCCAGPIAPGARYTRTFSIFDGRASTGRHCARCERDMKAFAKEHAGQRVTPDGFVDVLDSCIDEGDDDRRRWKAMLARIRARALPYGATA